MGNFWTHFGEASPPSTYNSAVKQRGRENKGPPDIAPKSFLKGPKWCSVPSIGVIGKSAVDIGQFLRRNCWMISGSPFLSRPLCITAENPQKPRAVEPPFFGPDPPHIRYLRYGLKTTDANSHPRWSYLRHQRCKALVGPPPVGKRRRSRLLQLSARKFYGAVVYCLWSKKFGGCSCGIEHQGAPSVDPTMLDPKPKHVEKQAGRWPRFCIDLARGDHPNILKKTLREIGPKF